MKHTNDLETDLADTLNQIPPHATTDRRNAHIRAAAMRHIHNQTQNHTQ